MNLNRDDTREFKVAQHGCLEWLIIGGGIHGTHLSHVLVHQMGVDRKRVAVVDPHEEPMWRWRHCTANTGMQHLRSPAVHHIDLEPTSLLKFARSRGMDAGGGFRPPYDRPALSLFEAHCRHVCEKARLCALRHRARANDLRRVDGSGFLVETDRGLLRARRVLLAMGNMRGPRWPKWAEDLRDEGAQIAHVFDDTFQAESLKAPERVGVVGMGISGAQIALRLVEQYGKTVQVVSRHELKIHQFDSDPCWLGPRCQVGFRRLSSYRARRKAIAKARRTGSMPRDVARPFQQLTQWEEISVQVGQVSAASVDDEATIELQLEQGKRIAVDALVLATGFSAPDPQLSWLSEAIERLELRCASCGFPIIDKALQWSEGLHVSGALAELELGPAARNIAGARMTARRLNDAVN